MPAQARTLGRPAHAPHVGLCCCLGVAHWWVGGGRAAKLAASYLWGATGLHSLACDPQAKLQLQLAPILPHTCLLLLPCSTCMLGFTAWAEPGCCCGPHDGAHGWCSDVFKEWLCLSCVGGVARQSGSGIVTALLGPQLYQRHTYVCLSFIGLVSLACACACVSLPV